MKKIINLNKLIIKSKKKNILSTSIGTICTNIGILILMAMFSYHEKNNQESFHLKNETKLDISKNKDISAYRNKTKGWTLNV